MVAPKKILVIGGVRSGKSRYAQQRAGTIKGERIFLATAEAFDKAMAEKIQQHQKDRRGSFQTVEEPLYLARAIRGLEVAPAVIVIDCLTVWVNNLLHHMKDDDEKIKEQQGLFLETIKHCLSTVIIVTNEVGMGIIPDNQLARRFIDQLGFLNQNVAAISDELILMVSGVPQWVKRNG
jgi:adenosylcobinamide kinase/adenosylcobinamide-phosphate guanylyltransferase